MNTFSQELKMSNESLKKEIESVKYSLKWTNSLIVGILLVILTAVIAVIVKTYF